MSPEVTPSGPTTSGGRGDISRWCIEHPYVVIAFYLGPFDVVNALAEYHNARAMWLRATGRAR